VAGAVSAETQEPFAPKIHYLLPHTHTLATGFFARVLGGPSDGAPLLDLGSFDGEAHGKAFDTPADLAGASGIEIACQYTNPRDETVGWGFGSEEMCELFGFAEGTPFFQARVNAGAFTGTVDGVEHFQGPCVTEQISGDD